MMVVVVVVAITMVFVFVAVMTITMVIVVAVAIVRIIAVVTIVIIVEAVAVLTVVMRVNIAIAALMGGGALIPSSPHDGLVRDCDGQCQWLLGGGDGEWLDGIAIPATLNVWCLILVILASEISVSPGTNLRGTNLSQLSRQIKNANK